MRGRQSAIMDRGYRHALSVLPPRRSSSGSYGISGRHRKDEKNYSRIRCRSAGAAGQALAMDVRPGCGHSWNTFGTRGLSRPAGSGSTACLHCSAWSPRGDLRGGEPKRTECTLQPLTLRGVTFPTASSCRRCASIQRRRLRDRLVSRPSRQPRRWRRRAVLTGRRRCWPRAHQSRRPGIWKDDHVDMLRTDLPFPRVAGNRAACSSRTRPEGEHRGALQGRQAAGDDDANRRAERIADGGLPTPRSSTRTASARLSGLRRHDRPRARRPARHRDSRRPRLPVAHLPVSVSNPDRCLRRIGFQQRIVRGSSAVRRVWPTGIRSSAAVVDRLGRRRLDDRGLGRAHEAAASLGSTPSTVPPAASCRGSRFQWERLRFLPSVRRDAGVPTVPSG